MRKISDTITRLAARQAGFAAASRHPGAPDRLSTLAEFGSNPGALKARFYLPDGLAAGAPLVVVLHGCTQDAAGYDHHSGWSQLADDAGFALLYAEQQRGNNPNLCFNWFQPADVGRDTGEALSIRQMVEAMVRAHGLDRSRLFVTGLSAGGAMAAAMLASYPEVFAGGAVIAGLAFGDATTIPQAFDRMRSHGGLPPETLRRRLRDASGHRGPWPRISIWQGTGDQTVDAANAQALVGQWQGVHQVAPSPTESAVHGKHARQVWRDDSDAPAIELNLISGMGHGTPLDPRDVGAPGPYMLDVGVSSTREIARFWGIAAGEAARSGRTASPRPADPEVGAVISAAPSKERKTPAREAPPAPSGVQGVIEDALRAAGLMR